ncbi:MAG: glycoside hydrolase family 5 protein [Verrucomicrobia bacterium]|nr:glycoside hydrolase family 5 protein [Verrucomicrobiota bacterium]
MRLKTIPFIIFIRSHVGRLGLAVAIAVLCASCATNSRDVVSGAQYPKGSPVDRHGALRVVDRQLCDHAGQPVVLRGISTHDLKWFGRFVNRESIRSLAQDWNVTVLRCAVYLTTYLPNRELEQRIDLIVSACEENGIYCIIDWHVLSERNPQTTEAEARTFFARKAAQYRTKPHVLYEICNEPNGTEVTWRENVKPYAEAIIPVIRERAPDSLIIVGTPTWSQDVDIAAQEPLAFENIVYAMHFYAGTHGEELRDKIRKASERIAIFCSEWGTTLASGDGGPFPKESGVWLDFVESRGISWCNWSLSDANEASALFRPSASSAGGWTESDLTASGQFVRARLQAPIAVKGE